MPPHSLVLYLRAVSAIGSSTRARPASTVQLFGHGRTPVGSQPYLPLFTEGCGDRNVLGSSNLSGRSAAEPKPLPIPRQFGYVAAQMQNCLSVSSASSWPATPRPERRSTWRTAPTRGLKRSSTFRNYTHSEPRFRALLSEDEAEMKLALVQRLDARGWLSELRVRLSDNSGTAPIWTPTSGQRGPRSTISLP